MTPTERAKRSDALYYETVSVTRRVLCDMIANREADLEDAQAKNEELWASNERMGLKYMAAMGELEEENDQLKAENDRLREQIHWLKQGDILHVLTDQEYIDQCERERLMQVSIDALDKENAKLRELVRDYEHCSMHADCSRCEYDGTTSTHCPLSPCFPDIDELSELGVDE